MFVLVDRVMLRDRGPSAAGKEQNFQGYRTDTCIRTSKLFLALKRQGKTKGIEGECDVDGNCKGK